MNSPSDLVALLWWFLALTLMGCVVKGPKKEDSK